MLYQNYSIWIQKELGNWCAYCDEFSGGRKGFIMVKEHGTPLKDTLDLVKMEIELEGMKELKRKMNKSVAEILKLDGRNNRHKQT